MHTRLATQGSALRKESVEDEVCPACATGHVTQRIVSGRPSILRCGACGHRFLDAKELPPAAYGEGYSGFSEDSRFLALVKRELEDEFIPRIPPPARVLDVGCGNGAFMVAAAATGYETVGVDVSIAAVARARANGFDAYTGALPGLTLPGQFQFVTLWDVIEHLDDPALTVRRAYDLLEPGGYLVVKAPLPSDGSFRLARHWQRARGLFLHVPDHVQFFTPASLETLLRRSGFAEVDMRRVGPMRGPKPWAGPRKFVARRLRRLEARLARSANLYAFAWKEFPVEQ